MQVRQASDDYYGGLNTLPPVPDSYIGTVSSSMFAGMMVGAVGWGTCKSTIVVSSHKTHSHQGSDLMGRITAFNATLFFTAVFGLLASFSNSFSTLCIALFFLGSSVGVRCFKTLAILFANSFSSGLNANRRHPITRTPAERKPVPCHCPFRFFLSWRRTISCCCSSCRPTKFLSSLLSSSL